MRPGRIFTWRALTNFNPNNRSSRTYQTGFQYDPVASIATSVTPSSVNQSAIACNEAVNAENVAVERGRLAVEQLQVAVHELVDRRLGAGVAAFVDLVHEPAPDLLGLRRRVRIDRDGLDEVVPLAAQRVETGVDADPQGPTRQRLDFAALALFGLAGTPVMGRRYSFARRVAPRRAA